MTNELQTNDSGDGDTTGSEKMYCREFDLETEKRRTNARKCPCEPDSIRRAEWIPRLVHAVLQQQKEGEKGLTSCGRKRLNESDLETAQE